MVHTVLSPTQENCFAVPYFLSYGHMFFYSPLGKDMQFLFLRSRILACRAVFAMSGPDPQNLLDFLHICSYMFENVAMF